MRRVPKLNLIVFNVFDNQRVVSLSWQKNTGCGLLIGKTVSAGTIEFTGFISVS